MPKTSACPPIHLITCVGIDSELAHLGHFVEHYCALGIAPERMHIILNCRDPVSPRLADAESLLARYGTPAPIRWIAPYTSDAMWARRRTVQQARVPRWHWALNADVDELHEYPDRIERFVRLCIDQGANCAQGVLVDRLSQDGRLRAVTTYGSVWEAFPLMADVQCAIGGEGQFYNYYGTVKMMAHRGDIFPARGGHFPLPGETPVRYLFGRNLAAFSRVGDARFRFAVPLRVHHFKWTAGLVPSLRQRLTTEGVSAAGAEYGTRLLAYLDVEKRIRLEDVPLCRSRVPEGIRWRWRLRWLQTVDAAYWYQAKLRNSIGRLLQEWLK